jgi:HSP20 family protein
MPILDDLMRLTRQLHLTAQERSCPACWQPATDIYRTREGWLIKMELAGVCEEEIELHTSGRVLVVRGRRCDRPLMEGCSLQSLEIAYSTFERCIELPATLEPARVSTEYRDGMLWVRLSTVGEQ